MHAGGPETQRGPDPQRASAASRLRSRISGLVAAKTQQEAAEAAPIVEDHDVTRICNCAAGERVRVSGTLKSVTLDPQADTPTLEADLFDGSGYVTLVWLGRRRISGIEPGRQLTVNGRVTTHSGRPMIFNPRYELHPLRRP